MKRPRRYGRLNRTKRKRIKMIARRLARTWEAASAEYTKAGKTFVIHGRRLVYNRAAVQRCLLGSVPRR